MNIAIFSRTEFVKMYLPFAIVYYDTQHMDNIKKKKLNIDSF